MTQYLLSVVKPVGAPPALEAMARTDANIQARVIYADLGLKRPMSTAEAWWELPPQSLHALSTGQRT